MTARKEARGQKLEIFSEVAVRLIKSLLLILTFCPNEVDTCPTQIH